MNATPSKTPKNIKADAAVAKERAVSTSKQPAAGVKSPATKAVVKVTAKAVADKKTVAQKATAVKKPDASKSATKAESTKGKNVAQAKVAAKPIPKSTIKTPLKTAPERVVTKTATPVAKKAAVSPPLKKAAPSPKTSTTSAAPASKRATAGAASTVIQPTPKPLGKRAAKKMMMEQMTQAAVVPTHAPDAAKATFSTMNERVMTPPVPSAIQKDPKRANNWKSVPVEQLTDQDVQAMPDSEYMNDVQLAFFRRKLSLLKADMLSNAGQTTEHLREDTVVVPDPADRATIEEEHALELRTRDRERKLLKKIEQSIGRIDGGEYGYCDETGEAIGVARLMARPTASLSLEAQQRRELKQKMFGD